MSSEEDENYVTVTVEARGREVSVPCREAMVATVAADGKPGPSLHVGTFDSKSIRVLAEAALSELLSAGVRAGIPMDAMRIELAYAAVHCDETEARGQVMLAAVSPSDASKLLLNVDLDDRDRTAHLAKELAASADF